MNDPVTLDELQQGLDEIRRSPPDAGSVLRIFCRPEVGERRELERGQLSLADGLEGDNWGSRGSSSMPDRQSNPDAQLTLMNARAIGLIAASPDRWGLAGDQLFVDLDLSRDNLPAGTRLRIGAEAVIEVTALPHTGCKKFGERFGVAAAKFINTPTGRALNLRGVNARVVTPGAVAVGDTLSKL